VNGSSLGRVEIDEGAVADLSGRRDWRSWMDGGLPLRERVVWFEKGLTGLAVLSVCISVQNPINLSVFSKLGKETWCRGVTRRGA